MKPTRLLEFICVPLSLACAGGYATPLATKLIGLLGREYIVTSPMAIIRPILLAGAGGLVAGVAAVVIQRRKAGRNRWSFYGLVALSVPIGALAIFVVEAVRPRFEGALGFPAMRMQANISSVPLWLLAVGFGLPFLILLREKEPKAPGPTAPGDRGSS